MKSPSNEKSPYNVRNHKESVYSSPPQQMFKIILPGSHVVNPLKNYFSFNKRCDRKAFSRTPLVYVDPPCQRTKRSKHSPIIINAGESLELQ